MASKTSYDNLNLIWSGTEDFQAMELIEDIDVEDCGTIGDLWQRVNTLYGAPASLNLISGSAWTSSGARCTVRLTGRDEDKEARNRPPNHVVILWDDMLLSKYLLVFCIS